MSFVLLFLESNLLFFLLKMEAEIFDFQHFFFSSKIHPALRTDLITTHTF